jgi:hypothetical protein
MIRNQNEVYDPQLLQPERELWSAVLEQAMRDLCGVGHLRAKNARAWIVSVDDSLGSFVWICGQLNFDADAVRQRLLTHAPRDIEHRKATVRDLVTLRLLKSILGQLRKTNLRR